MGIVGPNDCRMVNLIVGQVSVKRLLTTRDDHKGTERENGRNAELLLQLHLEVHDHGNRKRDNDRITEYIDCCGSVKTLIELHNSMLTYIESLSNNWLELLLHCTGLVGISI